MSKIETMEEFVARAVTFDFYTDMSDDHRVYMSGRRAHREIEEFAASDKTAKQLWKKLCALNLEQFIGFQFQRYFENVFQNKPGAILNLERFLLNYVAESGRDSTIGKAVVGAIEKTAWPEFRSWSHSRGELKEKCEAFRNHKLIELSKQIKAIEQGERNDEIA